MSSRRAPFAILTSLALASLLVAGLVLFSRSAQALPPAGSDFLIVQASVDVESRIGQETLDLTGTATIERSAPRLESGVEVQDLTIVLLELAGTSITGPVTIGQSSSSASLGEVRSKAAGVEFPASSFLDVYFEADVPASPSRTDPLTLHNETAVHLVPMSGGAEVNINAWPALGATYGATLDPCLPLFPTRPAEVCVNALSVTLLESAPGNPTYGVGPGGPSGFHPADLFALAPGATPTPTPSVTPLGGVTNTPTPTITPTPATSSGNDNFADAFVVPELPFNSQQDTSSVTVEPGEPLTEDENDPLNQQCFNSIPGVMGSTVWFSFTPGTSGSVTVDTAAGTFDTVLAVYTGSALDALTVVACNDDPEEAPFGLWARATFAATAGTTYYVQVGGFGGVQGQLFLSIEAAGGGGGGSPSSSSPSGRAAGFEVAARVTCGGLGLSADGCDDGSDGTQDTIDGLSFGSDFAPSELELIFSVAAGSLGLDGTAVAGQSACTPAQPQADVFSTQLTGGNLLMFDGDGLNGDCPTQAFLGLTEEPTSDDLNAITDQPPSAIDPDGNGVPNAPVFYSLATGSPSLAEFGHSPSDILYSMVSADPVVYASEAALGLQAGDEIDAFCLDDIGEALLFEPGDRLYFSLAAGSPTLADIGAGAADVLTPGPAVLHDAASLGLQAGDDLNALDCFADPLPTPTPTNTAPPTATPTPTPAPGTGDVNKDGSTTPVDATILLQFVAGLIGTIHADGDVNQDGEFTSVDATIILQFVAGFIPELPV